MTGVNKSFPYSPDVVHEVYHATRLQFQDGVGPFEGVAAQTVAAYESSQQREGGTPFDLVPAVHYISEATVTCFEHPEFAAVMPREVAVRAEHAKVVAKAITQMALDNGLLLRHYRSRPELSALLRADKNLELELESFEIMHNLGETAFGDVRIVGGGAHKFMRRALPNEDPGLVISRSYGLARMMAAIPRERLHEALDGQGRPYLRANNYRIVQTSNPDTPALVDFSPSAHARIHPLLSPRRGCAGAKILTPEDAHPTLMLSTWSRIARILLTDATTRGRPQPVKAQKKRK